AGSEASACRGGLVVGSVTTSGRHYGSHQAKAAVWDVARRRALSLHKGPYYYDTSAEAVGAAGRTVGYATWPLYSDDDEKDRVYRPVVWSGSTPDSLVDLLGGQGGAGSGAATSLHEADDGTCVVGGYAARSASAMPEAALWHLPEARCVPLHPSGLAGSRVSAVGARFQAGYGWTTPGQKARAVLWRGSAEGPTDLHPPSLDTSEAMALDDGAGSEDGALLVGGRGDGKALLWRCQTGGPGGGVAAQEHAFLHPEGFVHSGVTGVRGDRQVGFGAPEGTDAYPPNHALLWRGTPESVLDLHRLLPPDCHASVASGIDATGSGVVCGYTVRMPGTGPSTRCAVVWLPRP
ncbi:MAG TPA: hypothetical protein VM490_13255, partial [Armatimonadaceae bacterium]|nr:hypothetical protein [Armatimonadaceae bacterium]